LGMLQLTINDRVLVHILTLVMIKQM
jgi:hypothetical protein